MKMARIAVLVAVVGMTTVVVAQKGTEPKKKSQVQQRVNRRSPPRVGTTTRYGVTHTETALYEALNSKTIVDFADTPLNQVIEFLTKTHNVPMVIDVKALEEIGIGTDTPVTTNLKGIRLESALNNILRDLALDWIVHNEVLLITTKETAESTISIQTYDIRSLCKSEKDSEKLAELIAAFIAQRRVAKPVKKSEKKPQAQRAPNTPIVKCFGGLMLVRGNHQAQQTVDRILMRLISFQKVK